MPTLRRIHGLVTGLCLLTSMSCMVGRKHPFLNTVEVPLYQLPSGVLKPSRVISPNGKRVALITKRSEKSSVILDGVEGTEHDGILPRSLQFSENSSHLSYVARDAGQELYVIDGHSSSRYQHVSRVVMGADGAHSAAVVENSSGWLVVRDGIEGSTYGTIESTFSPPLFSPDEKHLLYVAKRNDAWHVVVDGAEGAGYETIGIRPSFSSSGSVVYVGRREGRAHLVRDGVEIAAAQAIENPTWSPDSRIAYAEFDGSVWRVVVGDKRSRPYESVDASSISFSSDGKRMGFIAARGNHALAVIDDVDGKEYDVIAWLTFSPDGKHAAYGANDHGKQVVVLDDNPGRRYKSVESIMFSPGSKHLAYIAGRGRKQSVVVDDHAGARFTSVGKPIFDQYDRQVSYAAQEKSRWKVVVDGGSGLPVNYPLIPETLVYGTPLELQVLGTRNNQMVVMKVGVPE